MRKQLQLDDNKTLTTEAIVLTKKKDTNANYHSRIYATQPNHQKLFTNHQSIYKKLIINIKNVISIRRNHKHEDVHTMKKRICFISGNAYPLFAKIDRPIGGAEVNMYYLAKKFAQSTKYEVSFVVSDYGQKPTEIIDEIKIIKLKYENPKKYQGLYYMILRRLYYFKTLVSHPCDVYILTAASEISLYVVLIAKLFRRKTIFRVAHIYDVDGKYNHLSFCITKIMFRFSLKRFNQIVVQNEKQKAKLFEKEKLPSVVIKNGLPIKDTFNNPKNTILWVGREEEFKRPMLFLELSKYMPNQQFIMIMQGKGKMKQEIIDRIKHSTNFTLIDSVSFFEIDTYYQQAKCLVSTSSNEGFPNVFIQACLAKTPILSYRVNPNKFITDYNIGCVCNDDTHVAKEFINSLDNTKIEELGKNGFEYVKQNHNIENTFASYKQIIDKL